MLLPEAERFQPGMDVEGLGADMETVVLSFEGGGRTSSSGCALRSWTVVSHFNQQMRVLKTSSYSVRKSPYRLDTKRSRIPERRVRMMNSCKACGQMSIDMHLHAPSTTRSHLMDFTPDTALL